MVGDNCVPALAAETTAAESTIGNSGTSRTANAGTASPATGSTAVATKASYAGPSSTERGDPMCAHSRR